MAEADELKDPNDTTAPQEPETEPGTGPEQAD